MKTFYSVKSMVEAKARQQHRANLERGGVFDKEGRPFSDLDVELKVAGRKVTKQYGRDIIEGFGEVVRPTIIAWNTGRIYTEAGQRIAACAIDRGVMMVDIDRGIDYFLPKCDLDKAAIMDRYDRNLDTLYCPPSLQGTPELMVLRDILHEAALKISPLS